MRHFQTRSDVIYPWLPITLSCIIAFIIASCLIGVYEVNSKLSKQDTLNAPSRQTQHVHPQNNTSSFYSIIFSQKVCNKKPTLFVVRSNRFLSSFASTPSLSVSARTAKEMMEWRSPISWARGCWWDAFCFLHHVSFVTIGYISLYFSFIIVEICLWKSRCKKYWGKTYSLKKWSHVINDVTFYTNIHRLMWLLHQQSCCAIECLVSGSCVQLVAPDVDNCCRY